MKMELTVDQHLLNLYIGNCRIKDWRPVLWVDGKRNEAEDLILHEEGDEQVVSAVFAQGAVALTAHVLMSRPESDVALLAVSGHLENRSDSSVHLGRFEVLSAGGLDIPGQVEDLLCLPRAGVIQPRLVRRFSDEECPTSSKVKVLFYNRSARHALLVGFDTFGLCDTTVDTPPADNGSPGSIQAACDFAGWELAPGVAVPVERLCISTGSDPYALLENWAERAAAAVDPPPRQWEDVPVGWLGWAWVDSFNDAVYEEVMLRNCRAIRERLPGHDIRYVWLSIGNLADGSPGAWLDWNYRHFPSGPEALVAKLRELGFRLGLWCGPFYICSALHDLVEDFSEAGALLQQDGEPMVVCQAWRYGRYGNLPPEERPCLYALDPTHPRSLAFIRDVFATYRAWGIRYYMIDFLNAGAGNIGPYPYDSCHSSEHIPGPDAYRLFLSTIRRACGDDTYLLSSTGPTVHNAGYVDAVRTGNDFGEGRPITPDSFFFPASYVINHKGFWTGPLYALRNQACSYYTHRRLYINDSGNVLTVDSPLSLEDARLHAAIHVLGGSPSMFGDDIARLAPERLDLLRKTLPRPRDVAFPVDLFDSPYPDHPKVFQHTVRQHWGRFDVVAIFNFSEDSLKQRLQWKRLGLPEQPHHVWEFFNQQYLGTFEKGIEADVPPGAVRLLRLTPDQEHPNVIGTDMHMLMGQMEILDMAWNEKNQTLAGRAWRPKGERGHLFLRAPAGMAVKNRQKVWIAKDGRDDSLIIKVALDFAQGEDDWAVQFEPL